MYAIGQITIHSGLATCTFPNTEEVHRGVHKVYTAIRKKNGYITITESTREITVILDRTYMPLLKEHILEKPRFEHTDIASVGVKFAEKYATIPGLLATILQQTTLQGINIVELASTFTEIVLYIDEGNTRLAFDTLYHLFGREKQSSAII